MAREIALLTNPTSGKGQGRAHRGDRAAAAARGRLRRPQPGRPRRRRGARPGPAQCVADGRRDASSWSAATAWCTSPCRRSPAPRPRSGSSRPAPATTSPATSTCPRKDPQAAADVVVGGRDPARSTWPASASQYFVTVLAAGFDSMVNERANAMTWPRGQMRYNLATLAELRVFEPLPVHARARRRGSSRLEAMLVAVGNGPSFGGGLRITQGAVARRRAARRGGHQADEQAGAGPDLPQAVQGHPRPPPGSTSTTGSRSGHRRRARASWRTPTASGSARCR